MGLNTSTKKRDSDASTNKYEGRRLANEHEYRNNGARMRHKHRLKREASEENDLEHAHEDEHDLD